MRRTLAGLAALAIAIAFSAINAMAQDEEKQKAAVSAAENWLQLTDSGKYAESWKASADFFQKSLTQDQWDQALQAARKPLGTLVSRKLKGAVDKSSLPGASPGEYVVIQFETSFANKKNTVETVTPMLQKDGSWKVSGYFIK